MKSRRQFLRFLAESPLLAAAAQENPSVLRSPKEALNVMDFEAAARKALPPAHFGYLATGVDDDATLRANRAGLERLALRPRRLVDISGRPDLRTALFGTTWETPIWICPIGNQGAFQPNGELLVAKAARARSTLQVLSTVSDTPIEQVAEAAGNPIWFQLYATSRWEVTQKLVRHAEQAGCPVLVLTVDTQAGRNTETLERARRADTRDCTTCHSGLYLARKPMFNGMDLKDLDLANAAMTWQWVRRLKDFTKMKLLIKGIETREDTAMCCELGVDGIIVSNHGGRAEESGRGTIDCLPEIVEEAAGKVPVLIDGGFRRGSDIFKALALGAAAVGVGRPYVWGLSAFGQAGVERVLEILRAELELIMRQCGTRSIREIGRSFVTPARPG